MIFTEDNKPFSIEDMRQRRVHGDDLQTFEIRLYRGKEHFGGIETDNREMFETWLDGWLTAKNCSHINVEVMGRKYVTYRFERHGEKWIATVDDDSEDADGEQVA